MEHVENEKQSLFNVRNGKKETYFTQTDLQLRTLQRLQTKGHIKSLILNFTSISIQERQDLKSQSDVFKTEGKTKGFS